MNQNSLYQEIKDIFQKTVFIVLSILILKSIISCMREIHAEKHPAIPVKQVNEGLHFKHWYTIFGKNCDLEATLETYIKKNFIGKKFSRIWHMWGWGTHDSGCAIAIVQDKKIEDFFPYWCGSQYEPYTIAEITEWSHIGNLEAIVEVGHPSGCRLDFFATDYAINKHRYKSQKVVNANIVGLVYNMTAFDLDAINNNQSGLKFSNDFCCYLPANDEPDLINYVGKILTFREYKWDTIPGYVVSLSLTPNFVLDVFIAKNNLEVELVEGKQVKGNLWLIGRLRKN